MRCFTKTRTNPDPINAIHYNVFYRLIVNPNVLVKIIDVKDNFVYVVFIEHPLPSYIGKGLHYDVIVFVDCFELVG